MQRNLELKPDRYLSVKQQLEAARREVFTSFYAATTGEAAGNPMLEQIKECFDDQPWLFRDSRFYRTEALAIKAKLQPVAALRQPLQSNRSANAFAEYLKTKYIGLRRDPFVRPTEQLPTNMMNLLAEMKDGKSFLVNSPAGTEVFYLAASRLEPVDTACVSSAIEPFLNCGAKRNPIEAGGKTMRVGARIEYAGTHANGAGSVVDRAPGQSLSAVPALVAERAAACAPQRASLCAEDIGTGKGLTK